MALNSDVHRNLKFDANETNFSFARDTTAVLVAGVVFAEAARVDIRADFCQAAHMFRPFRKFIAVLLAIWLPLFSGSALAASVAMQMTSVDCPPVAEQTNEHHAHHIATDHHHNQLAAGQDQAAGQHDQPNSSCKDCGVCHFACSGYLATVAIKMTETRLSTRAYATSSTQFQSFSSAPLDPPPLALA